MEKNTKKAVDDFVDDFVDEPDVEEIDNLNRKKVVLDEREGLIERVDKIYVTEDGRQLLREQY